MTLTDLTLTEALAALRARQISAVELVHTYLDRIAAIDGKTQAYLTVTSDQALAQAAAADRRRAEKGLSDAEIDQAWPLLGIPLAIKDVLCTEGIVTTAGSRILEGFIPPYTATSVQRLLAAGAIVLGKTNTDEFAMGSSTENSAYHVTHNPWKLDRIPGGSSGGSAAAVSARLAAAALGTDTGGSVRQPAAMCGVVGLKPTYGRVSRYGLIAFASSLDQVGTLARDVQDAALLLRIIAGQDPLDSTSVDLPVPDYRAALSDQQGNSADVPLKGLRVGVPMEYRVEGMQPDVERAVQAALEHLTTLGAELCEVSLPHTSYGLPIYYLIAPAEASANLARFDGVRYGLRVDAGGLWPTIRATRGQGFGPEVKRRIMLGTYALSAGYYDAYYLKAQKGRTLIKRDFDRAFEQVDVIFTPTTPNTAFRLGEKVNDPLQMYLEDIFTLPVNLAGICGISVPCGFSAEGLPIGLQILGPAFGETEILRVAYTYEQTTAWHLRRPAL